MGKLVAEAKHVPPGKLYREYETLFVAALRVKTTTKKNTNVLQHLMGYFKKELSTDEKQELLEVINGYTRSGSPHCADNASQALRKEVRSVLPATPAVLEPPSCGTQAPESRLSADAFPRRPRKMQVSSFSVPNDSSLFLEP